MKQTNGIPWSHYGPRLEMTEAKVRNADGSPFRVLRISDLNPEQHMTWSLSKWTMVQIGVWFIWRAFFPTRSGTP